MSSRRDDEFTDYVATGLVPLQRVAYLLCQDRQRAEDLVQATITKLYVHWARARPPTTSMPTCGRSWSGSSSPNGVPAGRDG